MSIFFLDLFIYFREEGREKEKERNIDVRVKHRSFAFPTHPGMGTKPATQARALTGNRTCDLSLCRMMPNQPSHTGRG